MGGLARARAAGQPGPGARAPGVHLRLDAPGALACTTSTGCIYADARARSTVGLDLLTLGPDVTLTVSGGLAVGQTVVLGARVVHPGSPVTVNVLGFVGLPGGGVLTGTVTGLTLETALDPVVFADLLTHTFTPADPAGSYVLGVRLTDPATGATLAQATRTIER